MAVDMAKLGDGVREIFPGVGNAGTGSVQFIGDVPARRVGGPLILVAGMRVNLPEESGMDGTPRRVRAVAVAVERDGFRDADKTVPSYRGVVITVEGGRYPTGPRGDMESVRLAWLRLAVESGTFRRVARMS
jgi:hypothetical protein